MLCFGNLCLFLKPVDGINLYIYEKMQESLSHQKEINLWMESISMKLCKTGKKRGDNLKILLDHFQKVIEKKRGMRM